MEQHLCPTCQQALPMTKVDVIDIADAVENDKLAADDAFKRTYLGHGKQSSVFASKGTRARSRSTYTSPMTRSATC